MYFLNFALCLALSFIMLTAETSWRSPRVQNNMSSNDFHLLQNNTQDNFFRRSSLSDHSVCMFLWTYIDTRAWEENYLNTFLWFMDKILFQSIDRQCSRKTSCPQLDEYMMIVNITGKPRLNAMIVEHMSKINNVVFF